MPEERICPTGGYKKKWSFIIAISPITRGGEMKIIADNNDKPTPFL